MRLIHWALVAFLFVGMSISGAGLAGDFIKPGEERFKLLYWAFSHFGYWLNPFEIAARAQEGR